MGAKEKAKSSPVNPGQARLYIVGGGIAGLSAAVFAVRDAKVPGKNIQIFESLNLLGGALDSVGSPETHYVTRGARKYGTEVFQSTWDLFSGIPSQSDPKITIKEEFFEFNRTHKKNARSRLVDKNRNRDNVTDFQVSVRNMLSLLHLIFIDESKIENRTIDSWFRPDFFQTNFWFVFCSMFGFEKYSDLAECKRYIRRFTHDLHRMVSGQGEVTTPLNQYDSMIAPITKWLGEQGVKFETGCKVTDLDLKPGTGELTVERIHLLRQGKKEEIPVRSGGYVFVTNGSMTADSRRGSMTEAPALETGKLDGSWTLWENLARKRPDLGNPSAFNGDVHKTKWVTFTVTAKDPLFMDLFEKFTGNKPGQADLVTFKDSGWLMSIHVPAQPHFANQPKDVYMWGGYGLNTSGPGDYVKKEMYQCSGRELLTEVCHQFGFVEALPRIMEHSICIPSLMPYECSHFQPRKRSDRPLVVPVGSTNLAFLGQFTESEECVYLVESSVRCGQMAVYDLLGVDKQVHKPYTAVGSLKTWKNVMGALFKR